MAYPDTGLSASVPSKCRSCRLRLQRRHRCQRRSSRFVLRAPHRRPRARWRAATSPLLAFVKDERRGTMALGILDLTLVTGGLVDLLTACVADTDLFDDDHPAFTITVSGKPP